MFNETKTKNNYLNYYLTQPPIIATDFAEPDGQKRNKLF